MFQFFLQLRNGTSLVRKHKYFHQNPGSSDINSINLANREGSGPTAWFRLLARYSFILDRLLQSIHITCAER